MRITACLFSCLMCLAQGVLLDGIAVVVDQSIIKDSDIDRDIRVTEFLDNAPPRVDPSERKKAAARLVDQTFLRKEIRAGQYGYAPEQEARTQLDALIRSRFHTQTAFQDALKRYRLDEETLLLQLRWQLTVLGFVKARFKPAVVVPDSEVDQYYRAHLATLRAQNPRGSEDDLRAQSRDILTEDAVNRLLFSWLDDQRKSAKVTFHEDGLA